MQYCIIYWFIIYSLTNVRVLRKSMEVFKERFALKRFPMYSMIYILHVCNCLQISQIIGAY
ncbi:hypothetical protein HanPI659440_Chr13g0519331 [Helianthus annuus]|nr:hypothetical protein HanPI659440_Chr13g0519331 [Helianthus annuus]